MAEIPSDKPATAHPQRIGAVGVEAVAKAPISPIGERIRLANGATLERLNPALLAELQAKDPRVRYIAADFDIANRNTSSEVGFAAAVTEPLGAKVEEDFPDTTLMLRGTSAAVISSFPFWPGPKGGMLPVNSVEDILARGSDRDSDNVQVSIKPHDGRINVETVEWLNNHHTAVSIELGFGDETDKANADQTFPVLLVYTADAFVNTPVHGPNDLAGKPSERISAIYITDKIVH